MCLLATACDCTCHYFQGQHNCVESICWTRPLSTFLTMFAFPSIFFLHNQGGNYLSSWKEEDSPLILVWLIWALRPKGLNPYPLKTRDANSNHNIANICFALPKLWFESCLKQSCRAAAFSTAKDHSFLWHVLWVLAHHLYIYRDWVMTHVHDLLVLSQGHEAGLFQHELVLCVCRHLTVV